MAAGRDARWGKEAKVARAKRAAYAGIWAGLFTGLMLSPAGAEAASSVADLTISVQTNVVGQAPSRPRAQTALSAAIESNRRGDYEQAALLFAQAQAGKGELSAKEQEELTSWLFLNNTALQARRDGTKLLQQAELAVRDGRTQQADELLGKV